MHDSKTTKVQRAIVIGPGPKTEGGITEVIRRVVDEFNAAGDVSVEWISTHCSGTGLQKIAAAAKGFVSAMRELPRANLVHIHSSANISFYRKSAFFMLAKLFRKPVIWHLHSPNEDFERFFGAEGMGARFAKAVLASSDRVVVLSDTWLDIVRPYVPVEKVEVIENPIPNVPDRGSDERVQGRILYLAHLIQRKGYPLLIEAFAEVADRHPLAKLVFAGSGEVEEAKKLGEALGIRDRIEFLGWIGEPARTEELSKASIFALPSYQEGLPMGILEAMAFGLAVIVTPVGGIGDVVVDGRNGFHMKPGDADSLASALHAVLSSDETCRRVGGRAKDDVQKYSASSIAAKWRQLYEAVLSEQTEVIFNGHKR